MTDPKQPAQPIPDAPADAEQPIRIDFATFVISLATQVSINLGLTDLTDLDVRAEVDLELALHTLDILGMLAEKTRGNLTEEEHNLLQKLLYDLRLRFVEVQGNLKP